MEELASAMLSTDDPKEVAAHHQAFHEAVWHTTRNPFLVTLGLIFGFDRAQGGFQWVEDYAWIQSPSIHYHLGIDGLSLILVVLTGFLTPLSILVSWTGITERVKEFHIFVLALEAG